MYTLRCLNSENILGFKEIRVLSQYTQSSWQDSEGKTHYEQVLLCSTEHGLLIINLADLEAVLDFYELVKP